MVSIAIDAVNLVSPGISKKNPDDYYTFAFILVTTGRLTVDSVFVEPAITEIKQHFARYV